MAEDVTDKTPIDHLSLQDLLDVQQQAAEALATAKAAVANVAAEMQRRFGESAKRQLEQAGKTHGTATLELQDGLVAKAEVRQTIKWDSAKLMELAKTMPWDQVAGIFKIEFSVPELKYKGVAAVSPELREKIDAARTTKIGEPIITLAKEA